MNILIRFSHGLGDAAQFTAVLQVLKKYHPDWIIDIASLPGKTSLFRKFCRYSLLLNTDQYDESEYDRVFNVDWWECSNTYADAPFTKASLCLEQAFGIPPEPLKYSVEVSDEVRESAKRFSSELGNKFALLHYQGNTSAGDKNISDESAKRVLDIFRDQGVVPVLLDWDERSPLITYQDAVCPGSNHWLWNNLGTGDGETLVALIQEAELCVAVDSGPLHCAMATDTPTIGLWTRHHPINFADISDTTMHLVPHNHKKYIRGGKSQGLSLFNRLYRWKSYHCFNEAIEGEVLAMFSNSDYLRHGPFFIRRKWAEQDLVIVYDIYHNDSYRMRILGDSHRRGPQTVVDIGAHIGTFARLYKEINPEAKLACVEVVPANMDCLNRNVGDFAKTFHAACTYESGNMILFDACTEHPDSTGGSMIVPEGTVLSNTRSYKRGGEVKKITLEEIASEMGTDFIDILKLDCEGSEYSILENTTMRERIGLIVGEYHGRTKWNRLRKRFFHGWPYSEKNAGDFGTFHLRNPAWEGLWV